MDYEWIFSLSRRHSFNVANWLQIVKGYHKLRLGNTAGSYKHEDAPLHSMEKCVGHNVVKAPTLARGLQKFYKMALTVPTGMAITIRHGFTAIRMACEVGGVDHP